MEDPAEDGKEDSAEDLAKGHLQYFSYRNMLSEMAASCLEANCKVGTRINLLEGQTGSYVTV